MAACRPRFRPRPGAWRRLGFVAVLGSPSSCEAEGLNKPRRRRRLAAVSNGLEWTGENGRRMNSSHWKRHAGQSGRDPDLWFEQRRPEAGLSNDQAFCIAQQCRQPAACRSGPPPPPPGGGTPFFWGKNFSPDWESFLGSNGLAFRKRRAGQRLRLGTGWGGFVRS